ncbi:MAG: alpha-amylase/4-alpha-glucanotransferase domain-containing protein [Thermodesulfobacteriota bacterium]
MPEPSARMTLLLVLHAHQPVGNFDRVFAQAMAECYRPVVQALAAYPEIRCGLHFSGPLLQWMQKREPELRELIASLCQRGQVEMLGGGYYEPLLASVPARDALAQVQMQTQATERLFGQRPSGFWLAERIWEPALPAKLAPAGLRYTIVDDTHLYYAGLQPRDMFGYHLTEREGHALALFPTHKDLRYTIPFREPEETVAFLRQAFDQYGPTCATYGDDMEKFGLWPQTWEWVFGQGWLLRFFEALLAEQAWLATGLPGSFMAEHPPAGRVYPPTASYEEMLTWALPAEASQALEELIHELEEEGRYEQVRRFLRGGMWDNFLVKYRESNLMHKRMLWVSDKLAQRGLEGQARDHLLAAQCNCAYWHGLFGGLYLGHLRQAVHSNLIAAEALADQAVLGTGPWASCTLTDLDRDGWEEAVLAAPEMDTVLHPGYGGSLSVLNLRAARCNLADTLTRRREAYHRLLEEPPKPAATSAPAAGQEKVASIHEIVAFKEEHLDRLLVYDWYQRACFQDHLLAPGADLHKFQAPDYGEWGDLITSPFTVRDHGAEGGEVWCSLRRQSFIFAPGGPFPLSVDKDFRLQAGGRLSCAYVLATTRPDTPACRLAVELNLTLLAADDPGKRLEAGGRAYELGHVFAVEGARELRLVNQPGGFSLRILPSQPATVWHYPVETVSNSESGLERTYQGSSLSLVWPLPGGVAQTRLELALELA